jgi:hypothetical protein
MFEVKSVTGKVLITDGEQCTAPHAGLAFIMTAGKTYYIHTGALSEITYQLYGRQVTLGSNQEARISCLSHEAYHRSHSFWQDLRLVLGRTWWKLTPESRHVFETEIAGAANGVRG